MKMNLISQNQILKSINALPTYRYVNDLWIITTYFNPHHYKTRYENFKVFKKNLEKSNLNFIVVEVTYGNDPFELDKSNEIMQIKGKDVMWQKERMLNLALKELPRSCKKVAWLDCDILFTNPSWAFEASLLLESHSVVHLFEKVVRLSKDQTNNIRLSNYVMGFGKIFKHNPHLSVFGTYPQHGETGFAWATKKKSLKRYGLYDACIAGGADHLMAHAFCGDWDSEHVKDIVQNEKFLKHFQEWSRIIYKDIRSRVTYVPGAILHLWHGELQDRGYILRRKNLNNNRYDPNTDIKLGDNNLWEWNSNKPELRKWFKTYFKDRKENGNEVY